MILPEKDIYMIGMLLTESRSKENSQLVERTLGMTLEIILESVLAKATECSLRQVIERS